jgi:hypothetical protein
MARSHTIPLVELPSITRNRMLYAPAISLIVFVGCGGGDEAKRPDVNAPIVQDELGGHTQAHAYAYGLGLGIGCNPENLFDSEISQRAQAAYDTAMQRNRIETLAGFEAGLQRGSEERSTENSAVC